MKEWFEDKTVALVGNAMSLFETSRGEEIDSHDVVVRLNKAAMLVNKFEACKSHGTRTDIWFFWSVVEYVKHFGTIDPSIKKIHAGHQFRDNKKIVMADFVYPNDLYQELKPKAGPKKNPTTGLIAIDYIMYCNPKLLSVYGFDFFDTPSHMDPDRSKQKRCPHNFDIEREYCLSEIFIRDNAVLK